MKILLTVHQFLPEHSSGTEILTFDTAQELIRLGHEVLVFTGFPAHSDLADVHRFDNYTVAGIHVERFHHSPVSMGGQSNVMEAEYNNRLVASHFRELLKKNQPDLVHFFHLARLSASVVDVCEELGVPMVLTPTDFWFVCPVSQLRLLDNSTCPGPDRSGVNCLRHIVGLNQPEGIKKRLNQLPDIAVATMIWGIGKGLFSKRWFAPQVKALYERPFFLKERINKLDRVVVPTRLMQRVLLKNGLRADKVVFLPFGINLRHSYAKKIKSLDGKVRMGFIGTLAEHKGAHILVKSVRLLPDSFLELKVYGDLHHYPEYVKLLRKLANGDDRISFCGPFPNRLIGEIFAELDVLIAPSIWLENTPLVIYSAQAAGCPVIASDVGGISEVIHHGKNGLLFAAGDVDGLASAMKAVVEDRALLQQLSGNAEKPRSIADYAAALVKLYSEILEDNYHLKNTDGTACEVHAD